MPIIAEQEFLDWSLDLLRQLEWKRFEELTAALCREVGLTPEALQCGMSGGVYVLVFQRGSSKPLAIVQSRTWTLAPVGIDPLHDLLSVMARQKVQNGIYITSGDFTQEAISFANQNSIDLLDGDDLLDMLLKLSSRTQEQLLRMATEGDYTTPTCPSCGIKMHWRTDGRICFWGCVNHPRCQQQFFGNSMA